MVTLIAMFVHWSEPKVIARFDTMENCQVLQKIMTDKVGFEKRQYFCIPGMEYKL